MFLITHFNIIKPITLSFIFKTETKIFLWEISVPPKKVYSTTTLKLQNIHKDCKRDIWIDLFNLSLLKHYHFIWYSNVYCSKLYSHISTDQHWSRFGEMDFLWRNINPSGCNKNIFSFEWTNLIIQLGCQFDL